MAMMQNRNALEQQINDKSKMRELNNILDKDGKLTWTLSFQVLKQELAKLMVSENFEKTAKRSRASTGKCLTIRSSSTKDYACTET